MNELLYASVSSVEGYIMRQPPEALGFVAKPGTIRDTDDNGNTLLSAGEEEELTKGIHQLETLLENAVDKNFDRFELFVLRNILCIKQELVGWVKLEHHKGIDFSNAAPAVPNGIEMEIDSPTIPAAEDQMRLRQLRQTFFATYGFNLELQAEKANNERVLSQLRNLMVSTSPSYTGEPTPFSLLAGAKDTKEAATFAAMQIGFIRNLVADANKHYMTLMEERNRVTSEGTAGGPDAERKQYIENMTRRHLEIARNLRLNARGEVVGSDYEPGALKKGSEEVQKVEEIAGKLGKGAW